jgi:hypothetical protein
VPNLATLNGASLNGGTLSAVVVPVVGPFRDTDAYDALLAVLRGLDVFAEVIDARSPDRDQLSADASPAATLTPTGRFQMLPDGSPGRWVRTVEYALTIKVREEDPPTAYRELDRINAILHNTLQGVSLGNFTIERLSNINVGSYDSASHPNYTMPATGTFGYTTSRAVGYRTSA